MSDNKLVKILTDAATITGTAAGYGWIAKKVVKEPMTSDPSVNLMNYVKFTVVVAASIVTKHYLEDQKILPNRLINIRIRLDLVKHLMIKISERSFTQRFDDSMSSFSSEKRIKFDYLIYTVQGDKSKICM